MMSLCNWTLTKTWKKERKKETKKEIKRRENWVPGSTSIIVLRNTWRTEGNTQTIWQGPREPGDLPPSEKLHTREKPEKQQIITPGTKSRAAKTQGQKVAERQGFLLRETPMLGPQWSIISLKGKYLQTISSWRKTQPLLPHEPADIPTQHHADPSQSHQQSMVSNTISSCEKNSLRSFSSVCQWTPRGSREGSRETEHIRVFATHLRYWRRKARFNHRTVWLSTTTLVRLETIIQSSTQGTGVSNVPCRHRDSKGFHGYDNSWMWW